MRRLLPPLCCALALLRAGCVTTTAAPPPSAAAGTGRVEFSGAEKFTLLLYSGGKNYTLVNERPFADALPGEYQLARVSVTRRDEQNRRWTVSSSGLSETRVQVAAGKTVTLAIEPFTLRPVYEKAPGGFYVFQLRILDVNGTPYAPGDVFVDGTRPAPPRLTIADASGKTVAEGAFRYG